MQHETSLTFSVIVVFSVYAVFVALLLVVESNPSQRILQRICSQMEMKPFLVECKMKIC